MPSLNLISPSIDDAAEVLAFEEENRAFFETSINARPPDYYSLDSVRKAIDAALQEARTGTAFQYLVRNESGVMLARVNLTRERRDHFHSAELGYRVAESATGKGVAAEAVRQVVALAFNEHGLVRLEATTREQNVGSVKVLERNGFAQFGRARRSFQLRGVWYDLLHFERHASPSDQTQRLR
jgi:[ribosomal protein S5]-alanine N-acetyltransferase